MSDAAPRHALSASDAELRRSLSATLVELAAASTPERFGRITSSLRAACAPSNTLKAELRALGHSARHVELIERLDALWRAVPELSGEALAFALETLTAAAAADHEQLESVWTGPATDRVTARHTTGVLFQLVAEATETLTLMTFAAYPIPGLVAALRDAHQRRGVRIRFVLETLKDSGGRLRVDAANAFTKITDFAEFYGWPLESRPAGALMRAKLVLADARTAFLTSANLTGHGVDANLELGLVVRGGSTPKRIARHLDGLIETKALTKIS